MPSSRAPDVDAVRRAVEAVPDPELPAVTIGMLGMVHHLDVGADGRVVVELLPTYSGCPATEMIARDVDAALASVTGVRGVEVRFRFDPPWSADRIDAVGRARLRSFGIAPPGGRPAGAPSADGRRSLPLLGAAAGLRAPDEPRPCPYCGSLETVLDSRFGPTPCRDLRWCRGCDQPFEAFRSA
jgi:ring-1,2-phenylacetyl-CoA epoxidase subunit PaaD